MNIASDSSVPCPHRVLGLEKVERVVVIMTDICRHAKRETLLWNILAHAIDASVVVGGLVVSLQTPLGIDTNTSLITSLAALLTFAKTCEVVTSVKQRYIKASLTYQGYLAANSRAMDARDLLQSIAEGGITENEKESLKTMQSVIQSLLHFAEVCQTTGAGDTAILAETIKDLEHVQVTVADNMKETV